MTAIITVPRDRSDILEKKPGRGLPGREEVAILGRKRWLLPAAILTLAVLALVGTDLVMTKRVMDRRVGFTIQSQEAPFAVTSVDPSLPGATAGLRKGDVIIAIDGTPIRDEADYDHVAEHFRKGHPVTFTVERAGQRIDLTVRPGVAFLNSLDALGLLTILAYLLLGLAALAWGESDSRAWLLFLFSAAVALELSLPGDLIGINWAPLATTLAIYLLNGIQIGIELHLASVIPRPRSYIERNPWIVPLFYIVGFLVGAVPALVVFLQHMGIEGLPITPQAADSFFSNIVFPLWAISITAILFTGVRQARSSRERSQALLVLFGVLPWAVYTVVVTLWTLAGSTVPGLVIWLQSIVLLIYPIAVLIAIFRYQLFDIEVVVRKGLIYGTLTGLMLLIFYAAIGAGGALVSKLLGEVSSIWVFSGATLLLGLLASPLHRLVQQAIDRKVFPERHQLRNRLVQLSSDLPALGQLPAMGRHVVSELQTTFAARNATLLLADPATGILGELASTDAEAADFSHSLLLAQDDPGLEALRKSRRPTPIRQLTSMSTGLAQRAALHDAVLVVPLLVGDRLVGLILLGRREGEESYGSEELELLSLFAQNAATVFENVRLFHSATFEGLTGLYRREAILERLEHELERAFRYGRPLTVGMADLDHFKAVNDHHGHLAGDALLKRVAEEIKRCLRTSDAVGRYGGEEFLLVLPETNLAGAWAAAEKVRSSIENLKVPVAPDITIGATVSIGLAELDLAAPPGESTIYDLIRIADEHLLEAKRTGRNRIVPPPRLPH